MSLELCMIVKDSGEKLRDTLLSWKPLIGYWTILDTGSTDFTPKVIQGLLGDIPGELFLEPSSNFYFDCFGDKKVFEKIVTVCGSPTIDFAKARNRALQLCSRKCDYIAVIDDTYQLVGIEDLKKKLGHLKKHMNTNAFIIDIRTFVYPSGIMNSSNLSLRIFRSSKVEYKWKHPIHEVLDIGDDNAPVCLTMGDDVYIRDVIDSYHVERSQKRFKKDLIVLEKCFDISKNQDEKARYAYHLVQTCLVMGTDDDKRYWLKRHIDTCGDKQDTDLYHSLYAYSRLTGNEIFAQRAIQMFPSKIEAYYELAYMLYLKRLSMPAYIFLKAGHDQCKNKPDAIRYHSYHMALQKLLIGLAFQFGYHNVALESIHYMMNMYNCQEDVDIVRGIKLCKDLGVWKEFDKSEYQYEKKTSQIDVKMTLNGRKKVVFLTGPAITGPWNGETLNVRGSETSIIKTAEHLTEKFDVFVYCECQPRGEKTINGVTYVNCQKFWAYAKDNVIDYLVCVRTIEFFNKLADYPNIRNYYFWCHDLGIPSADIRYNSLTLKKFIFLTKFHKEFVLKNIQLPEQFVTIIHNGIDTEQIERFRKMSDWPRQKVKHRFIYSSDANRGLYDIIINFPALQKLFPGFTLHIYCDLDNTDLECFPEDYKKNASEQLRIIKNAIKNTEKGIVHVGRVSKEELYKGFEEAEYWFYPTLFLETFCITALEAQYFKCKIIASNIGALSETVKSGILYDHRLSKNQVFEAVLKTKDWKFEKGYKWAEEHSYTEIAKRWITLFQSVI